MMSFTSIDDKISGCNWSLYLKKTVLAVRCKRRKKKKLIVYCKSRRFRAKWTKHDILVFTERHTKRHIERHTERHTESILKGTLEGILKGTLKGILKVLVPSVFHSE